jgi:DNA-binding FadR family transcriptional regulator
VLEARRLLEPRVAQLASLHATDADFDALRTTIERQRELAPTVDQHEHRFLQLDAQFHMGLARATRNATVVRLMRSLFDELEMARELAIHQPPAQEWAIEVHEQTLDAIRAGDLVRIEAVMDEHLGLLERTWDQESTRALSRPLPEFLRPGVVPRAGT